MPKIEIFDPPLCCPTGVCGPAVDPELTRIANLVYVMQQKGGLITRYNLATEPETFTNNPTILSLLHEDGNDALPIVLLEGKVVKKGSYPTVEELAQWGNIAPHELQTPSRSSQSLI